MYLQIANECMKTARLKSKIINYMIYSPSLNILNHLQYRNKLNIYILFFIKLKNNTEIKIKDAYFKFTWKLLI